MEGKELHNKLNEITAQYRSLLNDELDKRWESLTLNLIKSAELEVVWALVARQCTLVNDLSYSYMSWNDTLIPIIMRCMVENHINIAWITQDISNRSQMFVDYGLGRETKQLEFLKAKENQTEEDKKVIESCERWINSQRYTYLNKINVGSWKFNDVRGTANDAGYKEYYDIFYDVCSSATHSTWNLIAKHNLKYCQNPLHKDHRIPFIKEPDFEIGMFLVLTKVMEDTFELVDTAFSIKHELPSSYNYIISEANKL